MRITRFEDGCGFGAVDTREGDGAWSTIITKLDGWYEGADTKRAMEDRLGDGGFSAPLWRQQRKLTLGVTEWLPSRDATAERARQVSAVFRSGDDGHGRVVVDDPSLGRISTPAVSLDGRPKVIHSERDCRIEYELPLICDDPYLYGEPVQSQAFVQGTGTGLIFPLFDDADGNTTNKLEFGDELPQPATLINTGNATAYPVVTVTGDMRSGFILSLSGDKDGSGPWRIAWQTDTRPGSPVTVDFSGSVTVDGVDQSWALTERGWGGVRPGGAVNFSISPIAAGSGSALMTLRPTYL